MFPNRDFITVEGYQEKVGQTATVEVSRPGAGVVGSASSLVGAGDVAFEINHPGGVCWGAGTGLNVTPDILPGDTVSIKFGGTVVADTLVQDAYVTGPSAITGSTVTIQGHVGSGVDRDQFEQRIIEPAMKETDVGRRDVRALPGEPASDDSGAYTSSVAFGTDTFTATYNFISAETAAIAAAAGGARAMTWEATDIDGNRQGLTIAEFGEPGGPGMGGCPNGPSQSGPPAPTNLTAAPVGTAGDTVKISWTPAQAIPGTPAVTGYRATAVSRETVGGEQDEIGKRITGQADTGTTITGLDPTKAYDFYVVAVSSVGETFPAARVIPASDSVAPTVSATPGDGATSPTAQEVTLTSNEPSADIYYTTDGSDPITSGGTGAGTLYTGPISIGATTTITYAAIDPSGNVSNNMTATYTITNDPLPAAPTFTGAPVAGKGTASLAWNAPDAGGTDLAIMGYSVQAYSNNLAFGSPKTVAGDVTSLTYDGLEGDTVYQFTVRASNTNGAGPESAKSDPVTVQGALVAQAGADQTVVRRTTATPVTLDGTGSTSGATYKWEQVLTGATDPDKVTLTGDTTLKPTFNLPVYKYPMTNNPLTFKLTVTVGTDVRTDEVKVTPVPDRVAIGRAEWKSGDFRVTGTGSVVGSTITLHKGSLDGPVLGRATVTAAVAPATGGVYSLRLRDAAAGTANPGTVWIESSVGGVAGPTTVTNR
ncbi:hypothetical protein IWX75_000681 [Arthrobacter sp. CAN_A6]